MRVEKYLRGETLEVDDIVEHNLQEAGKDERHQIHEKALGKRLAAGMCQRISTGLGQAGERNPEK